MEKNIRCSGPFFSLVISLFSHWKRSYFEVLIKLKKIGHTICDPFLIFKNIFSLRHHGLKLFWTKVGDFSPMQQLFIVRSKSTLSTYFYEIMSKQHSFLKAFFTMCFTQFRFNLLCSSEFSVLCFPSKNWVVFIIEREEKGKNRGRVS